MASLPETLLNTFRAKGKPGVAGIWLDEHELVKAAAKVREAGFRKFDAISPFPLHGIDDAIGIPRSFIPWVCFIFGLTGCLFGVWFTWWTSSQDWALNIGGKPMWSLAAFIPVIFECTILLAALSSVAAMILVNGLPKVDPPIIDPDLTCSKFALFVPEDDHGFDSDRVEKLFRDLGAAEVKRTEF
ncbi:MAG: DUF3341 domain-containing protein [Bdellovibrionaceae bacterium]|nr:DUF3341 domain-containing protein [Bdellovibrionales bacterium]MCB9082921.1 DUF3341 domain-containing protein [Pseudobdellovibrionaceae bacterium]